MNHWNISEAATRLHQDALVWDMIFIYEPEWENDVRLFSRWLESGFNFVSCHPAGDNQNIAEGIKRVARARNQILNESSGNFVLVETVKDIFKAKAEGKLAVTLQLEGFRCLERDLNLIETYYKLGVRLCHPIFNLLNSVGGGCADRIDVGLSKFGVRVIEEMNRVGMIVDGAHAGYKATLDMIEVSSHPVVLSHNGCYSLRPHFRNMRDEQIRACAAKGGVIGISGAGYYLGGEPTPELMFKHIDHIVQMLGSSEHVGLGLDHLAQTAYLERFIDERPEEWPGLNEGLWEPMSFFRPEQTPKLTELMLTNGYPEQAIRNILGENFLRVCQQVWK
jgi:membrane dipeptidase